MSIFSTYGPRETADFKRIINLPQRDAEELGELLVPEMTELIKTKNGTMILRPLQALALAESYVHGGALVLMPVGQGKTLVTYLLPTTMDAKRPVLLLPGKLRNKTYVEFRELSAHWKAPANLRIISYEEVSTDPQKLSAAAPDLIIADESHKLKNKKAACTKRVWKYWYDNDVNFVPLSGTLAKRSFFDWWHLQLMALPAELCVLPFDWNEAELWAMALDEKPKMRADLGALKKFGSNVEDARTGYGNFLKRVPGVIRSDIVNVDASLQIEIIDKRGVSQPIQEALTRLIKRWELPDGTDVLEAVDFWRHSRELANGFYYKWAEQPPEEWADARRAFNAFVRNMLRCSQKWTAPAEAVEALREHEIVKRWLNIKKTFEPTTEAVWIDDEYLEQVVYYYGAECVEHVLIWYEHKAVGARLKQLGFSTFGAGGQEVETKQSIVDFKYGSAAVSIPALGEGFNLQRWSKNIILNCPPVGNIWEQMIGRTHRPGQKADTVEVAVMISADVQLADFKQARADAQYTTAISGQAKLSYADIFGMNER
jgi:hypothetical protein